MLDDDEQEWESTGGPPPLCGDESYQGLPAEDFENSRAEAVVAFGQGLGIGGGGSAASQQPSLGGGGASAGGGGGGNLWAAWSDAASKGVRPLDFGFLMPPPQGADRGGDRDMSGEDDSPSEHGPSPPKVKKRSRVAADVPEETGSAARGQPAATGAASAPLDGTVAAPAVRGQAPPCPPRRPKEVLFGRVEGEDRGSAAMDPPAVRTDVFAWMRGASGEASEEVRVLMEEENQYAEACQSHLGPLRERLYAEMMSHQREADESLLAPHPGGYGYFNRTFAGKSYRVHYRRQALAGGGAWGEEQLVLDENQLAINPEDGSQRPYCSVCGPSPNPSHTLFAYAMDFAGNDAYTLKVSPFGQDGIQECGRICLEHTDGSAHWSSAGDCFYYVDLDSEFRQYRVKRHVLGQDPSGASDVVLLEESDKKFWVNVSQTGCARFLVITCMSAETMENHLLDLSAPGAGLRRVVPRTFGHQYGVDHRAGWLYLLTNKDGVKNSKLCRVPLSALPDVPLDAWEDVWIPPAGTTLESHHCFQTFMALQGRERGECRLWVHGYGDPGGPALHSVAFPDAAAHTGRVLTPRGAQAARAVFSAGMDSNNLFETEVLRYTYSSFTVPGLTYEYHVASREHRLLRRQDAPCFDPDLYRAERISTPGRQVPISMVYRKDIHPQGLAGGPFPVLLTGYGAYGCCQDPDFDGNRLSLLDRGIVYAVVHIRGGGELGKEWHEEGKNLKVKNRFADFVEAAETLVNLRVAAPSHLAAWGTSSGGLLVTASVNLRPDLFRAMLLEVPFVDAMNTMSDPSIPLTVGEWEEIGNPNEREYFYYMLEYSPYDNVRVEAYPAALVTASLNDSMVGYWEPLKYVSKLRALKTDARQVLLQTNFHAGHGAASDRYQSTREAAFHFSFLLDELGLAGRPLLG